MTAPTTKLYGADMTDELKLTADRIDGVIADLGCRNAAGGIYTGSIYEFARAIYALDRALLSASTAAAPADAQSDAPLSLIPELVKRDETAVSAALFDMGDAQMKWRAEVQMYREITPLALSAYLDGYEAGIAAFLSARAALQAAAAAPSAEAQDEQGSALTDDARECLLDVVSHHDNIVAGFAAQREAAQDADDSDTVAYWQREINVAHRMQEQAKRALAAPTPVADSGATFPRYIVIGYGETDHPQVAFAQVRDELLDAVLGMIYTRPSDAPADIREAYRGDIENDDEWSQDGIWSVQFEIGGVTIYDLGEPVVAAAKPVSAAAPQATVKGDFQECAAQSGSCSYGPYGRHGESQCKYCGAAAPQDGATLTDEQIDMIANDGCRNAAGGIYSTCVHEFARAVEAEVIASVDAARKASDEQPASGGDRE